MVNFFDTSAVHVGSVDSWDRVIHEWIGCAKGFDIFLTEILDIKLDWDSLAEARVLCSDDDHGRVHIRQSWCVRCCVGRGWYEDGPMDVVLIDGRRLDICCSVLKYLDFMTGSLERVVIGMRPNR